MKTKSNLKTSLPSRRKLISLMLTSFIVLNFLLVTTVSSNALATYKLGNPLSELKNNSFVVIVTADGKKVLSHSGRAGVTNFGDVARKGIVWKIKDQENGRTFRLQDVTTGKVLNDPWTSNFKNFISRGPNKDCWSTELYSEQNWDSQKWTFVGNGSQFEIRPKNSTFTLAPSGGSSAVLTPQNWNAGRQKWIVREVIDFAY